MTQTDYNYASREHDRAIASTSRSLMLALAAGGPFTAEWDIFLNEDRATTTAYRRTLAVINAGGVTRIGVEPRWTMGVGYVDGES